MNYIAVYKKDGKITGSFFYYRDEKDVVFKKSTLIQSEDDVVRIVKSYIIPDEDNIIIKETFLDFPSIKDDWENIINYMSKFLED